MNIMHEKVQKYIITRYKMVTKEEHALERFHKCLKILPK